MSSKSASSKFYVNLTSTKNGVPEALNSFKSRGGGFPESETVLSCAKCSLSTQGFISPGYIVLTDLRLSFVATDSTGKVLENLHQEADAFFDINWDIFLCQVHRAFLVKRETSTAAVGVGSPETAHTSTPSTEVTKTVNLTWHPFPSAFLADSSSDFLYMQIQCTDFAYFNLQFDSSEPCNVFLKAFADFLDSGNVMYAYKFASEYPSRCLIGNVYNRFCTFEDWDFYLSPRMKLDPKYVKGFDNYPAFVAYCIFRQLTPQLQGFSDRERQFFPQFSFLIGGSDTVSAKYLFRYLPENPVNGNILQKTRLADSVTNSAALHKVFDLKTEMSSLRFMDDELCRAFDLISEYVHSRAGRSRTFAKFSIKNFRSLFDQSGWLNAVSDCLKVAAALSKSFLFEAQVFYVVSDHSLNNIGLSSLVTSLVQFFVSPQARTIHGFIEIIQKDWIAAGFDFLSQLPKFRGRKPKMLKRFVEKKKDGALASGKRATKEFLSEFKNRYSVAGKPSEGGSFTSARPPYFLLFLDCVNQLCRIHPHHFQFTPIFLCQVWDLLLTGAFANFFDRSDKPLGSCLWRWMESYLDDEDYRSFRNPLFVYRRWQMGGERVKEAAAAEDVVLNLDTSVYVSANMDIWDEMFFQYHTDCANVIVVDVAETNLDSSPSAKNFKPTRVERNRVERRTVIEASMEDLCATSLTVDHLMSQSVLSPKHSSDGDEANSHSDLKRQSSSAFFSSRKSLSFAAKVRSDLFAKAPLDFEPDLLNDSDNEDEADQSVGEINLTPCSSRKNSRDNQIDERDESLDNLSDSRRSSLASSKECSNVRIHYSSRDSIDGGMSLLPPQTPPASSSGCEAATFLGGVTKVTLDLVTKM